MLAVRSAFACCVLVGVLSAAAVRADSGTIHGVVTLTDGERVEGSIRWGRNGAFWNQRLSGVYDEPLQLGERTESVEVFGLKLWSWKEKDVLQLGVNIPFGLIAALEPDGRDACEITLSDGERIRVRGTGRDVGSGARVVVIAADGRERELSWRTIERVTFTPAEEDARAERRLFGTVTTSVGTFRGFVAWDRDEVLLDEELDGDEASLTFAEIAEIHRDGAGGARIVRRDGTEIGLSGTNDVNDDNRGIEVLVERLGMVTVRWDAFESFRLEAPPASPPRSSFRNGTITGKVVTRSGAEHAGALVWGGHERYRWETIDAELDRDVDLAARFDAVAAVEFGDGEATLVFPDGTRRSVREDDVEPQTTPVAVRSDAGVVLVDWAELASVRFDTND